MTGRVRKPVKLREPTRSHRLLNPTDALLHAAASLYATQMLATSITYRTKHGLKPVARYATKEMWLAHYEGYRAGFAAKEPT